MAGVTVARVATAAAVAVAWGASVGRGAAVLWALAACIEGGSPRQEALVEALSFRLAWLERISTAGSGAGLARVQTAHVAALAACAGSLAWAVALLLRHCSRGDANGLGTTGAALYVAGEGAMCLAAALASAAVFHFRQFVPLEGEAAVQTIALAVGTSAIAVRAMAVLLEAWGLAAMSLGRLAEGRGPLALFYTAFTALTALAMLCEVVCVQTRLSSGSLQGIEVALAAAALQEAARLAWTAWTALEFFLSARVAAGGPQPGRRNAPAKAKTM